jgi:hypothetical protein
MKKNTVLLIIIIAFAGIASYGYVYRNVMATAYPYGQPALWDIRINADGTRLYTTFPNESEIIEIDTATMEEVRSFPLSHPIKIELSPDGNYIFSTFYNGELVDGLARIRLSDGNTEILDLEDWISDIAIDQDGGVVWAVQRSWPLEGSTMDDFPDDLSGRLIRISTDGALSVTNQVAIESLPNSIYYGSIYNKLYVKHQLTYFDYDDPNDPWEEYDVSSRLITVYDADTLDQISQTYGGGDHVDMIECSELSGWDSTGRFMMVPTMIQCTPNYSFKVIDTLDDSEAFTEALNLYAYWIAGLQYAHPSPDWEYMWATVSAGQLSESDERKLMVRINRSTLEYDFFPIDEATDDLGDFAISPDGTTFYLTVPRTGEIIVWQP